MKSKQEYCMFDSILVRQTLVNPLLTLHDFALHTTILINKKHFCFSIICTRKHWFWCWHSTYAHLLYYINCYRIEIEGVNMVGHVLQLGEVSVDLDPSQGSHETFLGWSLSHIASFYIPILGLAAGLQMWLSWQWV